MYVGNILTLVQFFFAVVIGLYFWNLLRTQQGSKVAVERESKKELDRLRKMREIKLSEPLSERTRPTRFDEIIGQEQGLRALRAALCGPNPQHILIYGPPGVGKTAAARLVLEEARTNPLSPFKAHAKFHEIDATTARFDERGIADPLIGSVHDPIYQGAGPLGVAGVPQPKPGAVTRAHGGVLFIDEIGELHPIQMNKLLKVLEDRKVFLESAYYNAEDPNVPSHIQDIFEHGLPADFRLIGATTRMPQEIPPAIRSRCVEVFFRALMPDEVVTIARNAARKIGSRIGEAAVEVIGKYATNGREAVNIIQIAAGIALGEGRDEISRTDVEWVVSRGQYQPRPERRVPDLPQVGMVNGLAVYGSNMGMLLEVEAVALPAAEVDAGRLIITGVVDEEETRGLGSRLRRKSLARSSVENVLTALRRAAPEVEAHHYDIHVNFPGGVPVDGPSAGLAMAVAIYSAISGRKVDNRVVITGEVSIRGEVKPVGGVMPKLEAARRAGATRAIIPRDNWQESFERLEGFQVHAVSRLDEAMELAMAETGAAAAEHAVPIGSLAIAEGAK